MIACVARHDLIISILHDKIIQNREEISATFPEM